MTTSLGRHAHEEMHTVRHILLAIALVLVVGAGAFGIYYVTSGSSRRNGGATTTATPGESTSPAATSSAPSSPGSSAPPGTPWYANPAVFGPILAGIVLLVAFVIWRRSRRIVRSMSVLWDNDIDVDATMKFVQSDVGRPYLKKVPGEAADGLPDMTLAQWKYADDARRAHYKLEPRGRGPLAAAWRKRDMTTRHAQWLRDIADQKPGIGIIDAKGDLAKRTNVGLG